MPKLISQPQNVGGTAKLDDDKKSPQSLRQYGKAHDCEHDQTDVT
jgi:hypothetical protein